MNLIEISEREVIATAKAFFVESLESPRHFSDVEVDLLKAISLLTARETAEQALDTGTVPQPRIETLASPRRIEAYQGLITEPSQPLVDYPEPGNAPLVDIPVLPAPCPGAEPIPRRPKKLSRKERIAEERRKSDPMGRDRLDIDYSSDDLPSAR